MPRNEACRTSTRAAAGEITGLQNGWGSPATILRPPRSSAIAGLISQYGYDGLHVLRRLLVAYITVLLVIADPCRNIGRYTLPDSRLPQWTRRRCASSARCPVITVSPLPDRADGGRRRAGQDADRIDYEVSVIAWAC